MAEFAGVIFAGGFGTRMKSEKPKCLLEIEPGAGLRSTILGRLVDQMQKENFSRVLVLSSGNAAIQKWVEENRQGVKVPVEVVLQPKAYDWGENFRAIAGKLGEKESAVIVPGDFVLEQESLHKAAKAKAGEKAFLTLVFGKKLYREKGFLKREVACWVTNKKGLLAAVKHNPESIWSMLRLVPKIKRVRFAFGKPVGNINTPEMLSRARADIRKRKIRA